MPPTHRKTKQCAKISLASIREIEKLNRNFSILKKILGEFFFKRIQCVSQFLNISKSINIIFYLIKLFFQI